jgi:hypothetical protein
MGWLDSINAKKKEKIPERFKDRSEDDILKELDEADKAKKEVEELKAKDAERETKVVEIQTEFNKVKERLAAAEANKNQNQNQNRNNNEEPANFVEEPDKAFQQRVGPLAAITLQNAAVTARLLAQQQLDNADLASGGKVMDGRLFRHWGADIDAESKRYAPIQLGDPQAWIGIFYYLKGQRADELRDPKIREKKYNFLEPASTNVNTNVEDKKTPSDQLTDAEKHVADKMGVKHEDYLKRKKAMQFVNA